MMKTKCFPVWLAIALGVAACAQGSGSSQDEVDASDNPRVDASTAIDASDPVIDAAAIDAADPPMPDAMEQSILGMPCTGTCPAGFNCTTITNVGSTVEGFCTTTCMSDIDCANIYSGPGTPSCNLNGAMGMSCSIICTGSGMCPAGLACFDAGGGVSLCAGDLGT